MTPKWRLMTVVLMVMLTGVVWAQPPGGGGITTGGGLPLDDVDLPDVDLPDINVDVPDLDEIEFEGKSDIDIDIRTEELRATASAVDVQGVIQDTTFDATTFEFMMENYEVPEDWSQIQLTQNMPSQADIQAMIDELPHEIDINTLDIGLESSPEATSAIVGYASSMLGKVVTPLYAGVYGDSDIESNAIAQQTLAEIYSEIPTDMQALLTQADSLSGIVYWALLEDGLALLYTGDCELEQCSISQDMVQVQVTSGSAGAYMIYNETVPTSSDQAKALVQSVYPYLASVELSATESEVGTAFFAFDIDMESQQVTAYYAGVVALEGGQSIVYAVAGIGDAYINVLLGGG